jgi:hypothetical protein
MKRVYQRITDHLNITFNGTNSPLKKFNKKVYKISQVKVKPLGKAKEV